MQSPQNNLPKKQESEAEKKKISLSRLPFDRFIFFGDGIFAFAMTLLVINIAIPDKKEVNQLQVNDFIINNGIYVLNYVLSFLIIGYFWIIYNKLTINIEKTSLRFIWLNIFLFMFIVFIPFSTNLISYYSFDSWADFIFNINILIVSIILYLIFYFTERDYKQFVGNIETRERKLLQKKIESTIYVCIFAAILSFIIPTYSLLAYLVFFPIIMLHKKLIYKNDNSNSANSKT